MLNSFTGHYTGMAKKLPSSMLEDICTGLARSAEATEGQPADR